MTTKSRSRFYFALWVHGIVPVGTIVSGTYTPESDRETRDVAFHSAYCSPNPTVGPRLCPVVTIGGRFN